MVYRVYVEKKAGLQNQAEELKKECSELLGVKGLTGLRILNRYDADNLIKGRIARRNVSRSSPAG